MLANFPCSIVTHGVGLNITVQSYNGSLDFGLMADAQAMPDVRRLAAEVAAAAAEFDALAADDPDPYAPPPRRARPRSTAAARSRG
jgi:hypothetical protein